MMNKNEKHMDNYTSVSKITNEKILLYNVILQKIIICSVFKEVIHLKPMMYKTKTNQNENYLWTRRIWMT